MAPPKKKSDPDRSSSGPCSHVHSEPMFGTPGSHKPKPGPGDWKLSVYESANGVSAYTAFLSSLDPYSQVAVDIAVKEILGRQGHNVCVSNKIGKSLKGGLYEFKVGKSLSVLCNELGIPVPGGLGDDKELCLRVFFSVEGDRVVVLLAGYDKGKAPGRKKQDAEIEKARSLLAEHKEEVKRAKKGKKGR